MLQSTQQDSPWTQSGLNTHTLERNIDANNKTNKILSNNLLSSSVHHLLSNSNVPDNLTTPCGPLIDTQRAGDYDAGTTCLVRTQSGSLFIPSGMLLSFKLMFSHLFRFRDKFLLFVLLDTELFSQPPKLDPEF